jgi:GNAT superfamily N-acetyltransferase
MRQLRPHLTSEETFIEQVSRQLKLGYHLVYIQDQTIIKAAAGFRFLECLAWGKILYIDDLISEVAARRQGYGSTLLKWLIQEAKNHACDQVHLDSGPHRHEAHKLYLNHGFKIICHHFSLNLQEIHNPK